MSTARHRVGLAIAAGLFAVLGATTPGRTTEPGPRAKSKTRAVALDTSLTKSYRWRNIGPDRGGRSIAVAGVRGQPAVGYFGATGGGLWKTTDSGKIWNPVTDGQIHSSSVGAVAVSESNPNVVYIGMGEREIRGNIQPGDGMYKSVDAGKTWTHIGFDHSDAISKIRIDPKNPDVVYVADFGRYGIPSDERGLYKTTDGGSTWKKILSRNDKTGAVDISIDPTNPNIIFASLWEAYRVEYSMSSGGPGSGLFKSIDAGEHWTEITHNTGLPSGIDGKIGVAVSGANPNRIYAMVENENGGLYRSEDGGNTWSMVNNERQLRQRAFYYTDIAADPKNQDLVYGMNTGVFRSVDGGKTFTNFAGGDSHDMWIDPDNSDHVLHANDGGGAITYDASNNNRSWSSRAYPTGQFYHVATTIHVPYDVCGAQQDASTMCVPSGAGVPQGFGGGRGFGGGGRGQGPAGPRIGYTVGGAEPGYIAPDPKDQDIFYAGGNNGSLLTRLDRRSGNETEVNPYPRFFSGEESAVIKERWQWTYPIIFSPVDPNTIYTGSQHLWKTTNAGRTWDQISPDLTRHDPKTMGPSGGPITHDMNSPEVYAVIFSIGPSKKNINTIWTGSDDGLIQVTRDGGKTWTNVTPKDMPDLGRVSQIDASAFDDGSAYVAVKRPLSDDFAPYIFRTHDYGKTWTKIVNGIGANDYAHAVREDPTRRGMLYAGTQHGFYISYDDGDHWESFSLNLPDVQVSDIAVEDNSLAIATHGRAFYILDDLAPLRQYQPTMSASSDVTLFAPGTAIRSGIPLTIPYWVKQPAQKITIDVVDSKGTVAHTFTSEAPATDAGRGGRGGGGGGGGGRGRGGAAPAVLATTPGLHTAVWNLQYPGASSFPGMIIWGGSTNGPDAPPGTYTVRLTADGKTTSQPFLVRRNPLLRDVTDADLQAQFDIAQQILAKVTEANNAIIQIRKLKSDVDDRLKKSQDAKLKSAGDVLTKDVGGVEEDIYQVRNQSGQDPLNFPIKTNNRLASLLGMVERGDARPTSGVYPIFSDLTAELKAESVRLDVVIAKDLPAFNAEAVRLGLEPIVTKTPAIVP